MARNKVLFILHLPQPIHGAAMVGKFISESKFINNQFDAEYINLSTSKHLTQIGKGEAKKVLSLLKIQYMVLKALLSKKYDLVYMTLTSSGLGFYKDLIIVSILKIFRKSIIYHFHNKGISAKHHFVLDNILYQFAFNNTKSILLSPRLYSDIEEYVDRKNVFFCPNGIPTCYESTLVQSKSAKKNACCRLLFLSNMMVDKGVVVLLQACKLLKDKGLDFECDFVGDWSDITEEEFFALVNSYNLTGYIYAYGKQYGLKKHRFFLKADIFVFPTCYETFGLVNLEAMEFGLPIISTLEGGIPDVVVDGETGFLVPKKNASALAEKLEILIQQPELRYQMGVAGKKRFHELFTLDKFEQNFTKVLKKAINNKKYCN